MRQPEETMLSKKDVRYDFEGIDAGDEKEYLQMGSANSSSEKLAAPTLGLCPECATSMPRLDAVLRNKSFQRSSQDFTAALNGVGGDCAKCSAKRVIMSLSGLLFEMKEAKRSGRITREDRKALKSEAKLVIKDLKHDLKAARKVAQANAV